jgi:metal-responsive CopG/Arc/MetJ family transcriptional regulator
MREITITLPDEMVEELNRISDHLGISPDELIKRTIAEYLRRLNPRPNLKT